MNAFSRRRQEYESLVLWLTVLVILLAIGMRVWRMGDQSVWFDEGWSAYAAAQPDVIAAMNADATNPPLYYGLLHVGTRAWGDSEAGLRLVSLLLGAPTIALAVVIARRTAGRRAAAWAALLMALSAPLWWASQEARMYTLLALLLLIAHAAWWQIARGRGRSADWLILIISKIALLYAHNSAPTVIVALNATALLVWLAQPARDRQRQRAIASRWLMAQSVVVIAWLPYLLTRFVALGAANSAIDDAPTIDGDLLWTVWRGLLIAPYSLIAHPLTAALAVATLPTLALIVGRRARVWALAAALQTLMLIAGLIVLGNGLHGRYLVMITPLLLIAVAIGVARIRQGAIAALLLVPFSGLALVTLTLGHEPAYAHDDARGVVAHYARTLGAQDSVIAWSYADRYELAYYWERLDVQARRITLPEGADIEAILPLLPTQGAVALNIWYTQRADYRGMIDCLLSSGSDRLPSVHIAAGMTSLTYADAQPIAPLMRPRGDTFLAADGTPILRLTAAAEPPALTPDRRLCLPIDAELITPTAADWRIAVTIAVHDGLVIAQHDAILATANQRTTSAALPGERLSAYPLIALPFAAPPGDYAIRVRVYDPLLQPEGLTPAGVAIGRDLPLTTWRAAERDALWRVLPDDLPQRDAFTTITPDAAVIARPLPSDRAPRAGGDVWHVTLLWAFEDADAPIPPLVVSSASRDWSQPVDPPQSAAGGAWRLDMRTIRLPPDAPGGDLLLRAAGSETIIAGVTIDSTPYVRDLPPFDRAIGATFTGVGDLVGVDAPDRAAAGDPFTVRLVWRAGEVADRAAQQVVFVQALSPDSKVIAQSDSIPAGGDRPISGWRVDEVISDAHTLRFNDVRAAGDAGYRGQVTLIAGVYDAISGERIRTPDGEDAVTIGALTIE